MNEAEVDQFEDDFDDEERLMQADRPSIIHRTRHFRQRKRRKGISSHSALSRNFHQTFYEIKEEKYFICRYTLRVLDLLN